MGTEPFSMTGRHRAISPLRGVTLAEAEAMLVSCPAKKWTPLGDEERASADCASYKLLECRANGKTLIARLWFDFESVDHMADLARGSNFVACADGFCPDFALGEPRTDNVSACETLFKIQTVVNQP